VAGQFANSLRVYEGDDDGVANAPLRYQDALCVASSSLRIRGVASVRHAAAMPPHAANGVVRRYFMVMTATTVGFGDVCPHSQGARGFTIFLMCFGARHASEGRD
jgi:hypothetical protein